MRIEKVKYLVSVCDNAYHKWVEKVKSSLMNAWTYTGHADCDV